MRFILQFQHTDRRHDLVSCERRGSLTSLVRLLVQLKAAGDTLLYNNC